MSLIPTPATIADAPQKAQKLLEAVNRQLGVVPNMFRLISNSPPHGSDAQGRMNPNPVNDGHSSAP